MKSRSNISLILAALMIVPLPFFAAEAKPEVGPRKVAIFVVNREIKVEANYVKALQDQLVSRLAGRGLQVLTRDVVLDSVKSALKQPGIDDRSIAALKEISDFVRAEVGQDIATRSLEEELSKQSSAMRLAQALGADMVLVAAIQSYGHKKRIFRGNKLAPVQSVTHTVNLRVGYQLASSADGAAIAGDSIKVDRSWRESAALQRESDDLLNEMIDEAATTLAGKVKVANKVIKQVPKAQGVSVDFKVTPALPGGATLQLPRYEDGDVNLEIKTSVAADVVVDGISMGAVSEDMIISSGLHQIVVQAEGYKPWKRFVKVGEGQEINVILEMTRDGYERWKETISFFENMSRKKKLTEAEMKMLEAEAEALKAVGLVVQKIINDELKGKSRSRKLK